MFMEVEDETRDFLTIYREEFQRKNIEKIKDFKPTPSYHPPLNILNGPYQKCLNTRRQNLSLPLDKRSRDPQEILDEISKRYPRLEKIFSELPNEDVIEQKEKEVNKSVYQLNYSKEDYSPRIKVPGKEEDIVELPTDWIISYTIQKKSYRNPWKIAAENLLRVEKKRKPPDNLTPNVSEREILRIKTGDSEYNGAIDATGNRIMKDFSMGLLPPSQEHTEGINSSASECSQILASDKLMLPSNVF